MTIAVEERRLRSLFERVEAVEDVARTLAEDDERRAKRRTARSRRKAPCGP